ncbi:glycosyltransferase family 9 protein [Sulfurimonas sp. SAG-AH-194-C21]|nr:glycosyltransferase family 9 protein [Sulfurimonas sp. SAG-AH-194-C21]
MVLQFGEDTLIDFVSTPGPAILLTQDTRVHQFFPLAHKRVPIFLSSQKKEIIKSSYKEQYDILINFERGKHFKNLVLKIHAKQKIGHFFTPQIFKKENLHTVEVKKMMFKELVSSEVFDKSFPRLLGTANEDILQKYTMLNEKYIIISPSNSHQKRNKINYRAWQNDKWKELIEVLATKIQVVIVGNKNEDTFFKKLQPYPENVIDLVAKTPLVDLITIIKNAQGLVSTDTGTAHMASAVNTEVYTLIGPTPAHQTGPFKTPDNKVHIISANLECSPCYRTEVMKKCTDNLCMKEISVEQVFHTIKASSIF